MKNLLLISLLLPLASYGQVSYDFESGDLSGWVFNYPGRWSVDNDLPLSGIGSLHHIFDNNVAGIDVAAIDISTIRPDLDTVSWQFCLRYGYDPSSSNNWGIYLSSDSEVASMTPGGNASGFIIGVNLSGYDDTLRIWRSSSGNLVKVVTTGINWQNDIGPLKTCLFMISRSPDGIWSVAVGVDGNLPVPAGEGFDNSWFNTGWFGIYYRYTSTCDRLLWFDDLLIEGMFVEDTIPPSVINARFNSTTSIELELDEIPSPGSLSQANFMINGENIVPCSVTGDGSTKVYLCFDTPLHNKTGYLLLVKGLCDKHGNCSEDIGVDVLLAIPEWGDIVVSEFLPDPEPPVHLPPCEYIEILNRSGFPFYLDAVKLVVGTRQIGLPFYELPPGAFLVLTGDNCDWSDFPGINMLKIDGFPSIANGGAGIFLADTSGSALHGVEYIAGWSNDILKSEGGWSWEMVDTDYPFHTHENWRFSTSAEGGTPGIINSQRSSNPDNAAPWVDNVFPVNDSVLRIDFSEPVNISDATIEQWDITEMYARSLNEAGFLRKNFHLFMGGKISEKVIYELRVPGPVSDYNNNSLDRSNMGFGIPSRAGSNDLVINEVLFEALPWGSEYIEIFNNSELVFDASDLFMLSVNAQSGDTGKPAWLSSEHRCIMPGDYFAITTDEKRVLANYHLSDHYNIFELPSLPSLPDGGATLLLYARGGNLIDRMSYSKDMHFDLLSGTEGVSLERISPAASSESTASWHSASGSSGWGSPGVRNSVFMAGTDNGNAVTVSSRKISPDNDGFEDILEITVTLDEPGCLIRCRIFNDQGWLVRDLTGETTAGNINNFYWDGTSDNGLLLQRGIYIILVEVTVRRGDTKGYKKVCAIVR